MVVSKETFYFKMERTTADVSRLRVNLKFFAEGESEKVPRRKTIVKRRRYLSTHECGFGFLSDKIG